MPSIESDAAEACYLIFTSPEAQAQMKDRPELFGYWMEQLCPGATVEQISRAMQVAAELVLADLAEIRDEFERGTLVLPDSVFAES
jgi:hypothetical protein